MRKISLMVATLVMAANITVGGLMTLASVSIPVAEVSVGSVALTSGAAALLVSQIACSKDQLLASAKDVLDVVTSQELIKALQAVSPSGLKKLEGLVPIAKDLVAAIQNGNTSTALDLVNSIFPVIEEIAAILLPVNPVAMGVLGLANLALHFIINHVKVNVPKTARISPAVRQAIEYGNQAAWGCKYHAQDKRCTQ